MVSCEGPRTNFEEIELFEVNKLVCINSIMKRHRLVELGAFLL